MPLMLQHRWQNALRSTPLVSILQPSPSRSLLQPSLSLHAERRDVPLGRELLLPWVQIVAPQLFRNSGNAACDAQLETAPPGT